jgi:hypothetical protein
LQTVRGVSNWWPEHIQIEGLALFGGERVE